jgi:alkanesulfonate monooxygenase SsuD/methylene tetrahydromethanopterin reductase-like flavin-dependent oxidoreductase (luciferase family)
MMRLGLLGSAQAQGTDRARGVGQGFDDFIGYNIEAEALGYHSSFMVEHHFSGWAQVSATITLLTWIAARTTTLRLGTAVTVLPWHNPVLLAEQVATLDGLSGGRFDFGVGKGYRHSEFHGFCIPIGESHARFEEALEIMLRAWSTAGRFSHHGRFWNFDDIVVEPPPAQAPHPPVWMAAGREASVREVAARGFNLILDQFAGVEQIGERIGFYKAELAARGKAYDPMTVLLGRDLYIASDRADKEDALRRLTIRHQRTIGASQAPGSAATGSHILAYAGGGTPDVGNALIGTPEEIAAMLSALREVGVEYIAFTILGGSRDTLRRFAKEIAPAFSDEPVPAA